MNMLLKGTACLCWKSPAMLGYNLVLGSMEVHFLHLYEIKLRCWGVEVTRSISHFTGAVRQGQFEKVSLPKRLVCHASLREPNHLKSTTARIKKKFPQALNQQH